LPVRILLDIVDINALTAHIDLYKTFCELAGAKLPEKMQELSGRSLLPLLKNPEAEWPDRELYVHCGRWKPEERESQRYVKCAVRTQQWRFDNNEQLFDISKDPFETNDVAAQNPEVVSELNKAFDNWWEAVLPFMVNEGLPTVKPEDQPLAKRYYKQLEEIGIPEYIPTFTEEN